MRSFVSAHSGGCAMYAKSFRLRSWAATVAVLALGSALTQSANAKEGENEALVQELGKTKISLLDGIRQAAAGSAAAISAKFELEDGKLSLSVYTAEKGLGV